MICMIFAESQIVCLITDLTCVFSKLAENIIRALQRMKCPYRLDPQQLQGGANTSDFVNIYPVIQWLVKKVIETREETGDLMRMYSESQFAKDHRLPQEAELFAKKTVMHL